MCTRATFAGLPPLVATALLALGCTDSVTSEHPPAHPVPAFALGAVPVAGHTLYVPSGFTVNLFAEGLEGARSLALGPGGAVFVTLSNDGQIVRLVDTDGDGIADTRSTVLSGLDYPFGLAFRGDTMYFAEQTAVRRLDPGATTPVRLIPNLPPGGHITRTIAFGPDNLLYVAIGSSCNVCDDALPRAAVTRYNLDGSNPHTFATGLRNSVGMAFHPTTGELWANNNDRDGLGDDLPPEHLNILRDGRWYGWPQCYLPGEANPEYQGADCSNVEPPAFTFQAHSAPLGLAFYTRAMFPAEYQGDAFMTYHGSWNRSVPVGAAVVRVQVQSGRPTAIDDFVTGWQLADGSRWGRPVSLLVMPDGALLVSDDLGGRIFRVSFGQSPPVDETGDLDVTTATTGSDVDPDGYTVTVDGTTNQPIGIDGSITFSGLSAGSHTVTLSGVAPNCAVGGGNSQTVTVASGGTATTSFTITCTTPPGDLTVTTSTSGSSFDPDGYRLRLDGGPAQVVGINATFTYTNLAAGDHIVAISGVAANCTVSGTRSRTVSVPSGGTATVPYSVSCTTPPGSLTVNTSTSGSSQPSGYTVTVDESQSQAIGSNSTVTFTNVSAGTHSVALTDVAANCTVTSSNPQTVTVPSGGTVTASFSASCTTPPGSLTVTTSTAGSTLDPDGYTVTVDGSQSQPITINNSTGVTFTGLAAGSHGVVLSGVAGNCTVSGGASRTVTVPSGGTVTVAYAVSCSTPPGDLTATTSTAGSTLDPDGYTVTVDGSQSQPIAINNSTGVTFSGLAAGSHGVVLSGVAETCTVSGGASRTVTVPSGGTVTVAYSVSCSTPPGDLQVTTTTAGSSLDPDGYTVTVDGSQSQPIAITNGTGVTFTGLAAGSHSVVLSGVAGTCTVSGGASRTVTVPSGGTVTVAYSVSCTTPNRPPIVNAGADQGVLLGVLYTLPDASFSDPDNDGPWSYTIDWGDGSPSVGSVSSQGSLTGAHNYVLPGPYQITVTVTDNHGATGSDLKVLTVGSVPVLNR